MRKISAFLLVHIFIFTGISLKAQVVYTDIADTTYSTAADQYALDLDQNGLVDFRIILTYPSSEDHNQVVLAHEGSNMGGIETVLQWLGKLAWNLNTTDSITSELSSWMTSGGATPNEIFLAYYAGASMNGGNYLNQEGCLPLQFKIGTNTHYGWLRISVNANCTAFTIKDFAYEMTPGKAILVGDQNLELVDINETKIGIYPNPTRGSIYLDITENNDNFQVNIKTLNGKLVNQYQNVTEKFNNIKIPGSAGVYLMEIMSENQQRIIVQKVIKY